MGIIKFTQGVNKMKVVKRVALISLMFVLAFSKFFSFEVFALQSFTYENQAKILNILGLYDGVSTQSFMPDLQAEVDRETAIALLVKIFGDKDKALSMTDKDIENSLKNYSDKAKISVWAKKYIAYAVKTNMIQGDTATTISPKNPIDGRSFCTMILRNLGYPVDGKGWSIALTTLADKGGITTAEALKFNKSCLTKDDIVGISYGSLAAISPSAETLASILADKKVIKLDKLIELDLIAKPVITSVSSSKEDMLYNSIRNSLLNVEDETDISDYLTEYTSKDIFRIIDKIILETPQILYYQGCTYNSNGVLELRYSKDKVTALTHLNELNQHVDLIIKKVIKSNMTDYEKELAIHDYIINNARYDTEGYKNATLKPESYSAYGILVLGSGVCKGYSTAMKLMMDRVGIECSIVTGSSKDQSHAWNIVKIDGDYYHVDLTWNDPITQDGTDMLSHNYFNLTDKELAEDHFWDRSKHPPCTATKYNYFFYNNIIIDNYQDFCVQIQDSLQNRIEEISFKVNDYNKDVYDIRSAVKKAFNETCGLNKLSFEYSINESVGSITIKFQW